MLSPELTASFIFRRLQTTGLKKPQDALKVGDIVKVKITDIDFDKHRVSLSIRALLEEQQEADDKAAAESTEDAVVYVSQEGGVSEADEEAAALRRNKN